MFGNAALFWTSTFSKRFKRIYFAKTLAGQLWFLTKILLSKFALRSQIKPSYVVSNFCLTNEDAYFDPYDVKLHVAFKLKK